MCGSFVIVVLVIVIVVVSSLKGYTHEKKVNFITFLLTSSSYTARKYYWYVGRRYFSFDAEPVRIEI